MPLFLVTRLCDEGINKNSFRVVDAPSRIAVAEHIRRTPYQWTDFLQRSGLWDDVRDRRWSAAELLRKIDSTWVDGDSCYQMAIHEITQIDPVSGGPGEGLITGGDGAQLSMSYSDFTLKEVKQRFGLEIAEFPDLFEPAPEAAPSRHLLDTLAVSLPLAQDVNTEKARSEWIIAPILLEVRSQMGRRIALFSGVDFNVAPEQGLSGFCDYLISNSPEQLFLSAPVVAIVEAKKEDIIRGIPQCVAEMFAARLFNEREGSPVPVVYGAVTTGTTWRFLRYGGTTVAIDQKEYHVGAQLPNILGIFLSMFTTGDGRDRRQG